MPDRDAQQAMQRFMTDYFEHQKASTVKRYRMLNERAEKGQIVFAGSSLMEYFPIAEMELAAPSELLIYNRGVGASTTDDLQKWLDTCILDLEPTKLFVNIGSNDIGSPAYSLASLTTNYSAILESVRSALPECDVHVLAYYPVNPDDDFGLDVAMKQTMFATRTNEAIAAANIAVEQVALQCGCRYIDVSEGLRNDEGNLKAEFSVEGLHLWPNAYTVIFDNLRPYLS